MAEADKPIWPCRLSGCNIYLAVLLVLIHGWRVWLHLITSIPGLTSPHYHNTTPKALTTRWRWPVNQKLEISGIIFLYPVAFWIPKSPFHQFTTFSRATRTSISPRLTFSVSRADNYRPRGEWIRPHPQTVCPTIPLRC